MKDDNFSGLLAFGMMVGSFLLWCYGISICIKYHETFWAVVSFIAAPVGVLIGAYNLIF